ncbi:MAG: hypothetical protein PF518_06915 [Spirochaetaceae bacterium]|nr:hypothetical protein [Spirochaetaceae bacterium]
MYAYKDLQSLLNISVKWEKGLKDLYEVAELGIKNKDSKDLIQFLLSKQNNILDVIVNIDIHKFGQDEFVKFTPENHTEELIPQHEISKNTEPDKILFLIKSYESKLEEYYKDISDHLVSKSQKELFDSLVTLKHVQLEAIENYMKRHVNSTSIK